MATREGVRGEHVRSYFWSLSRRAIAKFPRMRLGVLRAEESSAFIASSPHRAHCAFLCNCACAAGTVVTSDVEEFISRFVEDAVLQPRQPTSSSTMREASPATECFSAFVMLLSPRTLGCVALALADNLHVCCRAFFDGTSVRDDIYEVREGQHTLSSER